MATTKRDKKRDERIFTELFEASNEEDEFVEKKIDLTDNQIEELEKLFKDPVGNPVSKELFREYMKKASEANKKMLLTIIKEEDFAEKKSFTLDALQQSQLIELLKQSPLPDYMTQDKLIHLMDWLTRY